MQDTVAIFGRVVPAFLLAGGGGTASAMAGLSHQWFCALISLAGGGFWLSAAHAVAGELVKHGKTAALTSFADGVTVSGILNLAERAL